jgi:hypothetical protein
MTTRRGTQGERLLAALEDAFMVRFVPGDSVHKVRAGDLEIELAIKVRRRMDQAKAADHQQGALAVLHERPGLVRRCGCSTAPKPGSFMKSRRDCKGRVVAAVVYQRLVSEVGYLFICGRHRDSHGVAACDVLGVVELTEPMLAAARKADAIKQAEWEKKWREEEAEREAERKTRGATR